MKLCNFRSLFSIFVLLLGQSASASVLIYSGSAADAAGLTPVVVLFRADLGALNPNVVGSLGSGRREVNWDGVPDSAAAPNGLPADFFNVNSPRGLVFSTPGTGFQVSASAASGVPVRFGNIDPTYPGEFSVFSPQRLFTSIGSNVMDVRFYVPGTNVAARTNGFGAVFTDVELGLVTHMAFYDSNDGLLYESYVAATPVSAQGLSFLGMRFTEGAVVSRVRITSGNGALGSIGTDLVVMDDFIYGEPVPAVPVPEPAHTLALGLMLLGLFIRRRQQHA